MGDMFLTLATKNAIMCQKGNSIIEKWKDISGYEGHYKISNFGRVETLKPRSEKYRKASPDSNGYACIRLSLNGVGKMVKIHRLVLEHFKENPEKKPFCNHIDSNRTNNRIENLEWCTHKENMKHAWKHGHGTIKKAQRMRNITQTFNAHVKHKRLQGQHFGSIKILGNVAFKRGKITADTLCIRCGSIKNKSIRAELKGVTKMCISCKNKSIGRYRRYKKEHEEIVSSA